MPAVKHGVEGVMMWGCLAAAGPGYHIVIIVFLTLQVNILVKNEDLQLRVIENLVP